MSHVARISHVTQKKWVTSRTRASGVTSVGSLINQSCRTNEWVISHTRVVSHIMNESRHAHAPQVSRQWAHTYESVLSHIWMSHITHKSHITHNERVTSRTRASGVTAVGYGTGRHPQKSACYSIFYTQRLLPLNFLYTMGILLNF